MSATGRSSVNQRRSVHRHVSNDSAIGPDYPAVDPRSILASKKSNRRCDVDGLPEPLERSEAREIIDRFPGFSLKKRRRLGRSRCNCADGDIPAAKLLRKPARHRPVP